MGDLQAIVKGHSSQVQINIPDHLKKTVKVWISEGLASAASDAKAKPSDAKAEAADTTTPLNPTTPADLPDFEFDFFWVVSDISTILRKHAAFVLNLVHHPWCFPNVGLGASVQNTIPIGIFTSMAARECAVETNSYQSRSQSSYSFMFGPVFLACLCQS